MSDPTASLSPGAPTLSQDRLELVMELGADLLRELDGARVLSLALAAGRRLTGARYAAIGVLDDSSTQLISFETSGLDEATQRDIGDLPQGHGILGLLISDPRPLRLDDIGKHAKSYGFPVGHPRMTTFLGVPIGLGDDVWGNFYLTEKDSGEPFDDEDEAAVVLLARWIAIAVVNARSFRAEQAGRRALERAVGALEATSALAKAVSDETDLERILELIGKRGRALVDARVVAIMLLDGEELVVRDAAGEHAADLVDRRTDALRCVCGDVLASGRPQRFDDIADHADLAPLHEIGAEALLCVPLFLRGRALGVLVAVDRLNAGPAFQDADEHVFAAFAASAGNAIATARRAAEQGLRRAIDASERERTRWARELHDETLQELAVLKLAIGRLARANDSGRADALAQVEEQVDRAVVGLRSLVTDLRPIALDEIGTSAALQALAERARTHGALAVTLDIDLDYEAGRAANRHTPAVEETTYRIVQEALSNVVRHAQASQASVSVREAGGAIVIDIRDDGHGFQGEPAETSFGLIGMRERIALVDGELQIESTAGRGTRVHAVLPARRRTDPAGDSP